MELHIFNSEYNLLRVTWGKVITKDSLRRHFDLLIANKHYPRNLRVITSSSIEEVGFSLTNENMERIGELRKVALEEYESIYTAIYSVKPIPAAYVSFFCEFFDSPKSCIKQFHNEQAALTWLLGDKELAGVLAT